MKNKEITFEQALERLEKIVEELEDGCLSLDKSLDTYTEGIKLIKFCNQELNQAEKKIEMVLANDEEFTDIDIVPFTQEEEA